MVSPRVADVFRIHHRFMRSVNLERDFEDHASLQGYVVTPHAKGVLDRLVSGLAPQSNQRAWRITGDYGTGKSSLALALAHLLSAEAKDVPAKIRHAVDFRDLGVSRPHLLPVLVTGSRDSLTVALLRGLERAIERVRTRGAPPRVLERLKTVIRSAARQPLADDTVITLLDEVAAYVRSSERASGLLIILDELGKFLEYAALHPDRQDVFFLQTLAELANRSGKHPLFVVGLLHQGFNAYAETLSQVAQKEWEKVAGRFEEILFNQPLEQTAGLVADALQVRVERLPKPLAALAGREMARAVDLGWYGAAARRDGLAEIAAGLYPLHPTVLPVLVRLFARFGQHERSLFSFLLSDEPFGLQAFSEQPLRDDLFYRLHHLYDYARAAFGSRLSIQSYRSHWNQIESVVESYPREDEGAVQVLKTVAVLNLIDAPPLLATDEALAAAVGGLDAGVQVTVRGLHRSKRVLYYRGAAGGYCLWPHTSVNLERAYQDASRALGTPQRMADQIRGSLETRPLVARRHYIETGNLRHFQVVYTPVSDLESALGEGATADGLVVVPLCETEEERRAAARFARTATQERRNLLVAVPQPLQALTGLVQECLRWQWIAANVPDLNTDAYAAEEVSRQIAASRQILEKRIRSYVGLRQFTETMELEWYRGGEVVPIDSGRDLLSTLSAICDAVYDQAPRVHNELVNRHALSSAAAAARMRLIERILKFPTQPLLGMDALKKPPEMSMYLSVLKFAGLHRQTEDGWTIAEPAPRHDPSHLRPVFRRIREVLDAQKDGRVRVPDLFAELRTAPYGVRDGLAPLLLAVFAVVHEQHLAFYCEGSFLRHLTGEDFQRLTKVPESFEIQYCRISGVRAAVFEQFLQLLAPEQTEKRKPDILDVVRPLCVFAAQLPAYTHRTAGLPADAAAVRDTLLRAEEPATLLFRQLPRACACPEFPDRRAADATQVERFVTILQRALDDLKAAYPELLARMKAALLAAFDRPGDFARVRVSLAATAGKLTVGVADPKLKAFCLRLADTALPEDAWIESLGGLLCSKPPAKWLDPDLPVYQEELKRLARQFLRVEAMLFSAGEKQRSAIRVAVTQQDGVELDRVLFVGHEEEAQAAEIERAIAEILAKAKRVGVVAATRALSKALTSLGDVTPPT